MPLNKKSKLASGAGKLQYGSFEDTEALAQPKIPKGKKRCSVNENDGGGDMQAMMSSFGADISKSLDAKKRRLETFTDSSINTSNKKVEEVWNTQSEERHRLGEEYKKQSLSVLAQWEADLEKTKAEEEKLQNYLKQQQKVFQQQRIAQTQRLKTIKKLHEQYTKGMDELDTCHKEQQKNMSSEIKEEMALFQKKILMETQYQDLSNVKRSLQNMLSQV